MRRKPPGQRCRNATPYGERGERAIVHQHPDASYAGNRAQGIDLGNIRPAEEAPPASLAGEIVICTPGALKNGWAERFPDPLIATASGWMQVRARARQISVLLPLVISDHADWPALCRTAADTGAQELWVTHGETEALVYWASAAGLDARPLDLIGYGDEDGEVAA